MSPSQTMLIFSSDRLALLRAQGVTRPPLRPMSAAELRSSLSKPAPRSALLLQALNDDRVQDRLGAATHEVLGPFGDRDFDSGPADAGALVALLEEDPKFLTSWGTPVEIASALACREREKLLTADEVTTALSAAGQIAEASHEIAPSSSIRRAAERLHRVHSLRSADSLQLAAAVVAADHDPATLEFICLDARLASAARREGFRVVDVQGIGAP